MRPWTQVTDMEETKETREEGIAGHAARMAKARKSPYWKRGPWDSEPDREEFEHLGLPCIIQRGGGGAWCGYVGIVPGHPLHGKGYGGHYEGEEYVFSPVSELRVHGGITYAESCRGGVCHAPRPGEPAELWWLGFDCAHYMDLTPTNSDYADYGAWYWNAADAKRETRRLAEQLKAWPNLSQQQE